MTSRKPKTKPTRLEDLSDAKQQKILERIKLCGYEDLTADDLMKEAGRLCFELMQLKQDKKDTMGGFNDTIKDVEERIEALRIQKEEMRQPPPMKAVK